MKKSVPTLKDLVAFCELLRNREIGLAQEPVNALAYYPRGGGLLGDWNDDSRRVETPKASESLTPEIRAHGVFQWLQRSSASNRAEAMFSEHRLAGYSPQYGDAAELRYWQAVAHGLVITLWAREANWTPPSASAAQKRAAQKKIGEVLECFAAGVGLADVLEQYRLERLLHTLREELKATKRPYTGRDALARKVLGDAASSLHGLVKARAVVSILAELSGLYGFTVAHRTLQRYATGVRSRCEGMPKKR